MVQARERVTLKVGKRLYNGWKTIRITAGVERAARDFEIGLSERWAEGSPPKIVGWSIAEGSACQVLIGGVVVLTGWIDTVARSISDSDHSISVSGRSKTGDLVDCAAIIPNSQMLSGTLPGIASRLAAPFGLSVSGGGGDAFPDFTVQQGETVYEIIERLSRVRGFLVCDDEGGNLVLASAGGGGRAGSIRDGKDANVKSAATIRSLADRFSTYTIKFQDGQWGDVAGGAAIGVLATIKDEAVTRYRPKVILAETGQGGTDLAVKRGKWECARRAGRGTQVRVTMRGWRDDGGALWGPNAIASVSLGGLEVSGALLIAEVSYQMDEGGGTRCELTLGPVAAYQPEPATMGGNKWTDVRAEIAETKQVR
jgi:prophage tail gpP-like protein